MLRLIRASSSNIHMNMKSLSSPSLSPSSSILSRYLSSSIERYNGVVKWYNPIKGFGFITFKEDGDDKEIDIFVHQSVIKAAGFRSLSDGENVEFNIKEENGKKFAADVTGPDGADVLGSRREKRRDDRNN